MAYVHAGYMGVATLGASQIRFSDANIAVKQEVRTEAMVLGNPDQGSVYVYGPITVDGSISGPLTESFATGGALAWGCTRGTCGSLTSKDVKLTYYCDAGSSTNSRTFTGLYVNNLSFSCAAGDIANFTLDVIGKSANAWAADTPSNVTVEKLITWDKIAISITPGTEATFTNIAWSNFEFSVANNCETAYSLGQSNLFPFEIVPGLRLITGTLTGYDIPQALGYTKWDDYTAAAYGTMTFNIAGTAVTMNVRFHRVNPTLNSGMITSTVGFTGVGIQSGTVW